MKKLSLIAFVVAALVTSACGSKSSSTPTTPSNPGSGAEAKPDDGATGGQPYGGGGAEAPKPADPSAAP